VIEFELSIDALGRSRFAYSPLAELASSLRALWSPQIGFVLQPWRHAMQSRLKSADLALLRAICPPGRFAPDFMFVWFIDPKITIDAQLNDLAQLPADQLRANLAEVWTDEALPDHVADLLEEIRRAPDAESRTSFGPTGRSRWHRTDRGFLSDHHSVGAGVGTKSRND
jgi:hypothetical protein